MDAVLLSRWQFAITASYHFLFIPITLGLSVFIAVLETLYVKTKKAKYKQLTKFWGKLFLVNFAMGVVTGIVQEFHFGMNWAEYSRFMGDIFGAPLAMEALTAFFLESTFLGLWIFGWERLSARLHLACIWIVAFAANLSSFWILVANSFMQNPVGYVLNNGRAEMVDFIALLTNPYVLGQFSHTLLSSLATAGMLIVAVSAYQLLRRAHLPLFRFSIQAGIVYALVGLFASMGSGHLQAQYLAQAHPMKLAAVEALWNTEDPAPFTIYASVDAAAQKNSAQIAVPGMLSFMVYNEPKGEIKGLKELQAAQERAHGPGNYMPDVFGLFWSFRIMIGAGMLMAALLFAALCLLPKQRLEGARSLLYALIWALPLPYIANTAGWYITEGGRQPWIVVGLQKMSDAVSQNITPTEVWISLIGFTAVYSILAVVAVYIALKFIKQGPPREEEAR